jgi:hypothetical protein
MEWTAFSFGTGWVIDAAVQPDSIVRGRLPGALLVLNGTLNVLSRVLESFYAFDAGPLTAASYCLGGDGASTTDATTRPMITTAAVDPATHQTSLLRRRLASCF